MTGARKDVEREVLDRMRAGAEIGEVRTGSVHLSGYWQDVTQASIIAQGIRDEALRSVNEELAVAKTLLARLKPRFNRGLRFWFFGCCLGEWHIGEAERALFDSLPEVVDEDDER